MSKESQIELMKFLGPEYELKTIDGELCIYRKINSKYDIELSGTTRKNRPVNVYVWDISNGTCVGARTVESIYDIKDRETLKSTLGALVEKYSG